MKPRSMLVLAAGAPGCVYAEIGAGYLAGTASGAGAYDGPVVTAALGFGTASYGFGSETTYLHTSVLRQTTEGAHFYYNNPTWRANPRATGTPNLGWVIEATLGGSYVWSTDSTPGALSPGLSGFGGFTWAFTNPRDAGLVLSLGGLFMASAQLSGAIGPALRLRVSTGAVQYRGPPFDSGRPLVHRHARVLASRVRSRAWVSLETLAPCTVHEPTRSALARAWFADALAEHASIGAFTRLSMQLLALGAPPELLAGAHGAARDEVHHTRLCAGLAQSYSGAALSPGALAVDAIREASIELPVIAHEALIEGCLGEGVAAALARKCHARTLFPEARRALRVIADDETRHTELAWAVLAWCLDLGGECVARSVIAALDALELPPHAKALSAGVHQELWTAHGRPLPQEFVGVWHEVAEAVLERAGLLLERCVPSEGVGALPLREAPRPDHPCSLRPRTGESAVGAHAPRSRRSKPVAPYCGTQR